MTKHSLTHTHTLSLSLSLFFSHVMSHTPHVTSHTHTLRRANYCTLSFWQEARCIGTKPFATRTSSRHSSRQLSCQRHTLSKISKGPLCIRIHPYICKKVLRIRKRALTISKSPAAVVLASYIIPDLYTTIIFLCMCDIRDSP